VHPDELIYRFAASSVDNSGNNDDSSPQMEGK
jgi:hypothetical protein